MEKTQTAASSQPYIHKVFQCQCLACMIFLSPALAVPPSLPRVHSILHLPGSFEALAHGRSAELHSEMCKRRDRLSFIYRGWRSKRDSNVDQSAPTPTPTGAGPDI